MVNLYHKIVNNNNQANILLFNVMHGKIINKSNIIYKIKMFSNILIFSI